MLVIVCHVFFGILRPILPFWTNAWLWTWTFRGRPELHHSPDDHLGSLFSHTPMSLEIYVYRYYVFRSNVEHSTRLWPNNLNNHLFFLNFWTNSPVVWLHSGWPVSPFRCSRTSRHAHCDIFNPMFAECQFGCFPARYPCLIMFASSMMLEVVTRKICGLVNQIS